MATKPSDIASKFCTIKCTEVSLSIISRERTVNTFFGVRTPPADVYTENRIKVIIVTEVIMNAKPKARIIPPFRMMNDSFLKDSSVELVITLRFVVVSPSEL